MEPNSDRYDTKEAILATTVATVALSQEIVDFLMEDQEVLEVLDMFFGEDREEQKEREDFHL